MTIRHPCPGCKKILQGPDSLAGKSIKCPNCKTPLTLPRPEPEPFATAPLPFADDDLPQLAPPAPTPAAPGLLAAGAAAPVRPRPTATPLRPRSADLTGAAVMGKTRPHLHWLLLAALLPLAVLTVFPGEPIEDRVKRSIVENPDLETKLDDNSDLEDLFSALPGHRFSGAHLARDSYVHWLYALLAATLFCGVVAAMTPDPATSAAKLFGMGFATGTAGIILLIGFQIIAEFSQGIELHGRGIIMLLFLLVKFIGFSYRAANDPQNGFVLSLVGFTCGVGLCEELCKALPLLVFLRNVERASARFVLCVGLASGVGFGISEAIMYSGTYYNGIQTSGIYVVRFVSCVALHAIWAGAVALLMYNNQESLQGELSFENAARFLVSYLLIAMVLHGLYDTLLKTDYHWAALLVAAVSFAWLTWLIYRQDDD